MLSVVSYSPEAVQRALAERARQRRLALDLSQQGLAERAGVTLASLKRFERTGAISLERLVRIALALGLAGGFEQLLQPAEHQTLDEVLAEPRQRARGRRR